MAAAASGIDWIKVLAETARAAGPGSHPKRDIVAGLADAMDRVCLLFAINTVQRQAHFVSQCAVESDYFQTLEEYASGQAYEGRDDLGNVRQGDGKRYKGRGPIQTTGRDNYHDAQIRLLMAGVAVDLINRPETLLEPFYGLMAAGCWWDRNHANKVADLDTVGRQVSRLVNRGNAKASKPANGEDKRVRAFAVAKRIIQAEHDAIAAAEPEFAEVEEISRLVPRLIPQIPAAPADTSGVGVKGDAAIAPAPTGPVQMAEEPASPPVPLPAEDPAPGLPDFVIQAAQVKLKSLGWYSVGYAEGEAGDSTVGAVAGYQNSRGLSVTGQLDAATIAELGKPQEPRAVGALRASATVGKLRAAGSQTIKAADNAIKVQVGGVVASVGAIGISGLSDLFGSSWAMLGQVREVFTEIPGWLWGVVALIITLVTIASARKVQNIRVEDERSGRHTGGLDPILPVAGAPELTAKATTAIRPGGGYQPSQGGPLPPVPTTGSGVKPPPSNDD
jgi:putative chitinase